MRSLARSLCAVMLVTAWALAPVALADGGLRSWEPLGPGTAGAIVRAVVVHPLEPNRILIGSPGGGIWLTTNGGQNWQSVSEDAPSQVVSCLAMTPSDPSILYAGTGESFAAGRGASGVGLLKSTDGGDTWSHLSSTASWADDDNRYVNSIAVHPTQPGLLLVATDAGIQRSTDGGQTWDSPLPRVGRATEVHFYNGSQHAVAGLEPNRPGTDPSSPPTVFDDLECALYSTDAGQSWDVSDFVGMPASTSLCADAGAGENVLYVGSGADFGYLDFIQIGTPGNAEVVQVLAVGEQCNCCSGGNGLGCDDEDCQTAVCNADAFCCNTDWDSVCDNAAQTLCTCCSTGCPGGADKVTLRGPSLAEDHSSSESVLLKISQRVALGINADSLRTYASMGAGGGTIWGSNNLGASYIFVSNPNKEDGHENFDYLLTGTNPRAFYSNVIWAAPLPAGGNDVVVVGGVEALRSIDGGVTFTSITKGVRFDEGTSAHIDHHALAPAPGFPTVPSLYFGNDGGLQRADDLFAVQEESGWTNFACIEGIDDGQCPTASELPCNCCSGGDALGCDCESCEETVCGVDAFCCGTSWDSVCDGEATTMCSCCLGQQPGVCTGANLGLGQFWCGGTTPDGEWLLGGGQDIDAVVRQSSSGLNDWVLWNGVGDARGCAISEDPAGIVDMYILRNNQLWKINACEPGTPSPPAACTHNSDCLDSPACSDGICNCLSVEQTGNCPNAPCNFLDCSGTPVNDTFERAVTVDPNDSSTLVAGGNRIWRTTNKGAVWNRIDCSVNPASRCSALAIAEGDPGSIWAGYERNKLFRTQSSDVTNWAQVTIPTINAPCRAGGGCAVSDILIDPDDHDRVFVSFVGYDYDFRNNCCEETVLMTTDGGFNWVPAMGTPPHTLPPTAAFALAMHPEETDWLYVGTDRGVYASEDGGTTWGLTPIGLDDEGPSKIIVSDLSWHDPDYLVATTYGLGMHRARAPRTVFVDKLWAGDEDGTEPQPFDTVQEGVDLAGHGTTISIKAGSYTTGGVSFTKRGQVVATDGTATID